MRALQRVELVLEARGDHFQPEVEKMPEDRFQIEPLGPSHLGIFGRNQARQVHRKGDLHRSVLVEIRHHHLFVGVLLHLDGDAHVLGRDVLDVDELRQLPLLDHLADLRDELRLVHGVRDAVDVDGLGRSRLVADIPRAAQPDAAAAGLVDRLDLVRRVQNLAAGRKIRPFDVARELRVAELVVLEQLDERRADLAEVVRGNVGGHAHGNARRAVDEQVRQPRRQHYRFGFRPVVVRTVVHRILLDLGEQLIGDAREAAFGVAHGRRGVAVERSKIAGTIDQRVSQRKGLRHPDERFVNRGVAVRMKAAHHVADDLCALAVLGVGGEPLLPHRVQDAALHRLQPIAHVRQRARGDHRERVIQIPRLCGLVQRHRALARAVSRRPAIYGRVEIKCVG